MKKTRMIVLGCSIFFNAAWVKEPRVWNLPPQNLLFTDRESFFRQLDDILKHKSPVCVVTGGPGFGKSQFVKEYAHRFYHGYQVVWWFDVNQTLMSQFVSFAHALNKVLPSHLHMSLTGVSPERALEKIKEVLRKYPIKCLFIFDNAQELKKISELLPLSHDNHISILITSRKKSATFPFLKMEPFALKDSTLFVQKILPQEKREQQLKLANVLSGHPLALATALTAIYTHPSVCIATYLKDRKAHQTNVLEKGIQLDQYEHSIDTALKLLMEFMQKASPEAAHLVQLLTFFSPTQIPFSYIKTWVRLKAPSQTADQLLKSICEQSLLEVTHKFDPYTHKKKRRNVRLTMHDLVHQILHQHVPEERKRELLPEAIAMVAHAFRRALPSLPPKILREPEYAIHALTVSEEARRLKYHSIPLLSLRIRLLDYVVCGQREFEKALPLIADIKQDQKILLSHSSFSEEAPISLTPLLDSKDEALLEIVLGVFEALFNSNLEKEVMHQEKALQITRNMPQDEAKDLQLRALTNLLDRCRAAGDLKKAKGLLQNAKELFKTAKNDNIKAFFATTCTFLLVWTGQFREALAFLSQHDDLWLRVQHYPNHIFFSLFCKAKAFYKLGNGKEGDKIINRIYRYLDDIYGTKDILFRRVTKTLHILNHLSESTQETVQILKKTLQYYDDLWQPGREPLQAYTYFVLGRVYERLGDLNTRESPRLNYYYSKAAQMYEKSHAIYDATLKEKTCDDVSELWIAIAILGQKRGDLDAQIYKDKHIETFGIKHPRSDKILKHFLKTHTSEKTNVERVNSAA